MEDVFYEARNALSQMFMVPAAWFEGPIFVVNLIIPFITSAVLFYVILSNKLRIFRNTVVNLALGFCLAFFAIPFSIALSPYLTIFVSVFGIVTLLGSRITGPRMLLALLCATAAWFLASYLANIISTIAV
ncbi:MAG: hypothetical protein ABIA12_02335 [Candidatus Aenigmatarchaeota archaeon]